MIFTVRKALIDPPKETVEVAIQAAKAFGRRALVAPLGGA
jgi:hypothetical protein